MKKIYVFSLFVLAFNVFSYAQCSIDSTPQGIGISPKDSVLPAIIRGVQFDTVLQVYVPAEATILSDTAFIYWATIDTITGFPTGITYSRYPEADTTFSPGFSCIRISGITTDTAGTYPLAVQGYLRIKAPVIGDTALTYQQLGALAQLSGQIPNFGYQLKVINATGMRNINNMLEAALQVSPNPNGGQFEIKLNNGENTEGDLRIMDALGRIVYYTRISSNGSYNAIVDLTTLAKGIYSVNLHTQYGAATKLVAIQ